MTCPNCSGAWMRPTSMTHDQHDGQPVVLREYRCYECGHRWDTVEQLSSTVRDAEHAAIRQEARMHAARIWQIAARAA